MSEKDRRAGDETEKRFYRADDRIFRQDGQWYYSTREGDVGPFANEDVARLELEKFIHAQVDLQKMQEGKSLKDEARVPKPRTDVWDGLPDVD